MTEQNQRRIAAYYERTSHLIAAAFPEYLVRCEHGKRVQARAINGPRRAKVVPIHTHSQPSRAGGT